MRLRTVSSLSTSEPQPCFHTVLGPTRSYSAGSLPEQRWRELEVRRDEKEVLMSEYHAGRARSNEARLCDA